MANAIRANRGESASSPDTEQTILNTRQSRVISLQEPVAEKAAVLVRRTEFSSMTDVTAAITFSTSSSLIAGEHGRDTILWNSAEAIGNSCGEYLKNVHAESLRDR